MNKPNRKLYQLYQQHGALTFMLGFAPLIPNLVEAHTKAYLKLTKNLTGSIDDIDNTIRILFGARGLKAYQQFKLDHQKIILPIEILDAFFQKNDPDLGAKLIKTMFFDPGQRACKDSDKFRASIILSLPNILNSLPGEDYQPLRSQIIADLSNQAIIDQAITSQLAFIDTALSLMGQLHHQLTEKKARQMQAIFASIEGKIKAELAGKSSAFTAPPPQKDPRAPIDILLTDTDQTNLKEVLLLLAVSQAPEVSDKAKSALYAIENLNGNGKN